MSKKVYVSMKIIQITFIKLKNVNYGRLNTTVKNRYSN